MNGVFFCLYVGMHWDDKMLEKGKFYSHLKIIEIKILFLSV